MGLKLLIFGYVSGLLLVTFGLMSLVFVDKLIHSFVTSSVKLDPNTNNDLYNQWLKPPVPVYLNIYLFNLKNGADVLNGAKPVVEEIGPFVYREYVYKENIVNNCNYTITYNEVKDYVFVPELSPYEHTYPITSVSMAALTIINYIRYKPDTIRDLVNLALKYSNETLLVTKPARDILFGYEDPLLKEIRRLDKNLVPDDMVGLFYGKNDTSDGLYTIYTGVDDYRKIGIVERFNRQNVLNYWTSKWANQINGTDGTLSAPFIEKSTIQYIFDSDLCRSLYLVYNGTHTTLDGIELYAFSPTEYLFANVSVNPDNAGFCLPAGNCMGAGVLNMSTCITMGNIGVPIVMSSPHFLFGDPKYLNGVSGVSPNYTLHQTTVYYEPMTGLTMKAHKRAQFNTQLFRDPRISFMKNLPEVMLPLMWLDENFDLDQASADQFYYGVKLPLSVVNVVSKYVLLGLGALILLTCLLTTVSIWRKSRQNSAGSSAADNDNYDENSPLIQ